GVVGGVLTRPTVPRLGWRTTLPAVSRAPHGPLPTSGRSLRTLGISRTCCGASWQASDHCRPTSGLGGLEQARSLDLLGPDPLRHCATGARACGSDCGQANWRATPPNALARGRWQGSWLLLHGLAAIYSGELRAQMTMKEADYLGAAVRCRPWKRRGTSRAGRPSVGVSARVTEWSR